MVCKLWDGCGGANTLGGCFDTTGVFCTCELTGVLGSEVTRVVEVDVVGATTDDLTSGRSGVIIDGTNEAGSDGIGDASCGLDTSGVCVSAATMTAGGGMTNDGGIGGGTIPGNGGGMVPGRNGTAFTAGNGGGTAVDNVAGGNGGLTSDGGGGGISAGSGGGGTSVTSGGGGGTFSFGCSTLSSIAGCTWSSLTLESVFFSTTGFAVEDFPPFSDTLEDLASPDFALDLLLLLGLIDLLVLLGLGDRLLLLILGERLLLLGLGDRLPLLGLGDRSLLCRNGEYLLFRRLAMVLGGLVGERLEYLLL